MPKTTRPRVIIQIIPAPDWFAVFKDEKTGEEYYEPLPFWALVRDETPVPYVIGGDVGAGAGAGDGIEDVGGFVRYEHRSRIPVEKLAAGLR